MLAPLKLPFGESFLCPTDGFPYSTHSPWHGKCLVQGFSGPVTHSGAGGAQQPAPHTHCAQPWAGTPPAALTHAGTPSLQSFPTALLSPGPLHHQQILLHIMVQILQHCHSSCTGTHRSVKTGVKVPLTPCLRPAAVEMSGNILLLTAQARPPRTTNPLEPFSTAGSARKARAEKTTYTGCDFSLCRNGRFCSASECFCEAYSLRDVDACI